MELTPKEKELLSTIVDNYIEKLANDAANVHVYMRYARACGEIADHGDKYIHNIRFWEVRNKIQDFILQEKELVFKLRNKLI